MKKFIKILVILVFLYGAYSFYYRYTDFGNGCDIVIGHSFFEWSNLNIKKALKVLKYGSPDDYSKVCKNVKVINPNPSCGGFRGGCFKNIPNEIDISTAHNDFVAWTAAVIVHEACHIIQSKERRPFSEDECYAKDSATLGRLVEF